MRLRPWSASCPPIKKQIDEFFAAIAAIEKGFQYVGFSYLAVRFDARFVLLHGRVFLNTSVPPGPAVHFQSAHVRAGHYRLTELKLNIRELIDRLKSGTLPTPDGELLFPPGSGNCAASFIPLHPEGLQEQRRIGVLTIMGGEPEKIRQPDLDWEVKAASPPYDGLQELSTAFGLGQLFQRPVYVEIIANNVAIVDTANCKVSGTKADIAVALAKDLDPERVSVGYRVDSQGTALKRDVMLGRAMQWIEKDGFQHGSGTLQIANASVLNCAVSYGGIAQSHWWLADPDQMQNVRRAVIEAFDPKLATIRAIIAAAQGRGQVARDLEAAVSWLLWMLGFSVAHLGSTSRTTDAADILATTPGGHFAVVECTTGLLKAENKLAMLHHRAETVRAKLAASGNSWSRVLPVMVTSRTSNEITADVEAAEKLGVYVLTREGLEDGINRTLIPIDANQLYAEAEQAVAAALAKNQSTSTGEP